jgi:hypothetical protein
MDRSNLEEFLASTVCRPDALQRVTSLLHRHLLLQHWWEAVQGSAQQVRV